MAFEHLDLSKSWERRKQIFLYWLESEIKQAFRRNNGPDHILQSPNRQFPAFRDFVRKGHDIFFLYVSQYGQKLQKNSIKFIFPEFTTNQVQKQLAHLHN